MADRYTLTEKILIANSPSNGGLYRCAMHGVFYSEHYDDKCPNCGLSAPFIMADGLRAKFAEFKKKEKPASGKRLKKPKKVSKKTKIVPEDRQMEKALQTLPATSKRGVMTFADRVMVAKLVQKYGSYRQVGKELGIKPEEVQKMYDQVLMEKIEEMQQGMDKRAADLIRAINSENAIVNATFLQQSYMVRKMALDKLTMMIDKVSDANTFALPHIINAVRLLNDIINNSLMSDEEKMALQEKMGQGNLKNIQVNLINELKQVTKVYINKHENGKAE